MHKTLIVVAAVAALVVTAVLYGTTGHRPPGRRARRFGEPPPHAAVRALDGRGHAGLRATGEHAGERIPR